MTRRSTCPNSPEGHLYFRVDSILVKWLFTTQIDPEYAFLHAFILIFHHLFIIPKFMTIPKNTPFFFKYGFFAPLNNVSVYNVHCLVLKNSHNYVFHFTRMISTLKYKCPPPTPAESWGLQGLFPVISPNIWPGDGLCNQTPNCEKLNFDKSLQIFSQCTHILLQKLLIFMKLAIFKKKFLPKYQVLINQTKRTVFSYSSSALNLWKKVFTKLCDSSCKNAKFSSFWGGTSSDEI